MQNMIQDFVENGVVSLGQLFTTNTMHNICTAIEAQYPITQDIHNPYGTLLHNVYREIHPLEKLLYTSLLPNMSLPFQNLAEIAMHLLQLDEVVLFQDNLIWKHPNTTQYIHWHQDYSYWPLHAPWGVTFWIALEDCLANSGYVEFIKGSHRWGECSATDFTSSEFVSLPTDLPNLASKIQDFSGQYVGFPIAQGHAFAHHPLAVHRSGPNTSPHNRRGWSLTWISPQALWNTAHAPHPYPIFHTVKDGTPVQGADFPRFRKTT